MATFQRFLLSGSTGGKPIPVAATATPGTLVHTAINSSNSIDEIYLWVSNTTNAAVQLTLEWGGVTDPANLLVKQTSIPSNSAPIAIAVGQNLNGALSVTAYASAANALNITGFVNRIGT